MDLRKLRLNETASTYSAERDEYERDYARLIQSPAFRRLQGKSQVFGAGSGDYYRTRLTHSLEVSQIAREVARRMGRQYRFLGRREHPGLMLVPQVVECASLAHDLGHPPFGHKGKRCWTGARGRAWALLRRERAKFPHPDVPREAGGQRRRTGSDGGHTARGE
ncbi:HD domain-containing protein [Paenibacillus sp. P25]|nr:HD domain-containing protein [Paenibacillus sp. P25]